MKDNAISDELLDICREAVRQVSEEDRTIDLDTEMTAESGIDSLAFMNIVLALEERFHIEIDSKLIELKQSVNVAEFIDQIQRILLD